MGEPPVRCSRCGRARDGEDGDGGLAALAWVSERDERGDRHWLCPACTRTHVRDIESKLDQSWW